LRYVPLVVFSGSSDLNVIDRCDRAGANSFLEKPLDMADYMTQVAAAARYWLTLNLCPRATARRASAM
jgi:FixJ family two-component response regulator